MGRCLRERRRNAFTRPAIAAATLADGHLVYAGDPMQLPPIVQGEGDDVRRWFCNNVFSWLNVSEASLDRRGPMTLLRTQYRMKGNIGRIVSRLSYGDRLVHGRDVAGVKPSGLQRSPV